MTMSGVKPKSGISFPHDEIPWPAPPRAQITVAISGPVGIGQKHHRKYEDVKLVCPICQKQFLKKGKDFNFRKSNHQQQFYCTRSCAVRGQWANKR